MNKPQKRKYFCPKVKRHNKMQKSKKLQPIFRYPGGKSILGKKILNFFPESSFENYYEPFIGGGGMLFNVLNKYPDIQHIYVNDLNENVAAFWKTISNKELLPDLLTLITTYEPTVEHYRKIKSNEPQTTVEKAYKALFLNKTSFSGLGTTPIGGWNQTGKWKIGCCYNQPKLVERITYLNTILENRIHVFSEHFNVFMQRYNPQNSICYLDPPYYNKGKMLYNIWMEDKEHEELATILHKTKNWILSYDICDKITNMYESYRQEKLLMTRRIVAEKNKNDKKEYKKAKEYVIIGNSDYEKSTTNI